MKKLILTLAVLLLAGPAYALQCQTGRDVEGSSDSCWTSVKVASNETTLVSIGTVLVYDVSNAVNDPDNSAFQVRVADASADGVFVAGVAQTSIASGATSMILVRGKGDLALKANDTIASGGVVFVSTSGDASIVTSNTQNQLGFVLEPQTAIAANSRTVKKAYITIV